MINQIGITFYDILIGSGYLMKDHFNIIFDFFSQESTLLLIKVA